MYFEDEQTCSTREIQNKGRVFQPVCEGTNIAKKEIFYSPNLPKPLFIYILVKLLYLLSCPNCFLHVKPFR